MPQILLTDEEILDVCREAWDEQKMGCSFPEGSLYDNMLAIPMLKAQIKKIALWLENLPTDGWDKWHFYHKDLAEQLLKECE